jgi:hypothetical protein
LVHEEARTSLVKEMMMVGCGIMEQPLIPEFKLGRTKGLQGTEH